MFSLFRGACVGGLSLFVQSAFVADTDGAAVEGAVVCSHFKLSSMLGEGTLATDVEMISYGTETSGFVVS